MEYIFRFNGRILKRKLKSECGVNVAECYFSTWNFNVDTTWKTITDLRGIHVEK